MSPVTRKSDEEQWSADLGKRIGRSIAAARAALGMNQDELAAKVGMSRNGIANLETGRASNPRISTVLNIAAALDISPLTLLLPNVLEDVEILPGQVASGTDVLAWLIGLAGVPGTERAAIAGADPAMYLALCITRAKSDAALHRYNAKEGSSPDLERLGIDAEKLEELAAQAEARQERLIADYRGLRRDA